MRRVFTLVTLILICLGLDMRRLKRLQKSFVACLFLVGFAFGPVRFFITFPHFFSETAEVNGWEITYNNLFNAAYLDCYIADPDEEDFEITVPDEYNGLPVYDLYRLSSGGGQCERNF